MLASHRGRLFWLPLRLCVGKIIAGSGYVVCYVYVVLYLFSGGGGGISQPVVGGGPSYVCLCFFGWPPCEGPLWLS